MRSIEKVRDILRDKSEISRQKGKGGVEVYIEKEILEEAAIYLEDYMELLEK